jgi:hypothetical protein
MIRLYNITKKKGEKPAANDFIGLTSLKVSTGYYQ